MHRWLNGLVPGTLTQMSEFICRKILNNDHKYAFAQFCLSGHIPHRHRSFSHYKTSPLGQGEYMREALVCRWESQHEICQLRFIQTLDGSKCRYNPFNIEFFFLLFVI